MARSEEELERRRPKSLLDSMVDRDGKRVMIYTGRTGFMRLMGARERRRELIWVLEDREEERLPILFHRTSTWEVEEEIRLPSLAPSRDSNRRPS